MGDFGTRAEHRLDNVVASRNFVEPRNDPSRYPFLPILRNRAPRGPQLFGINFELGQRCHAEKTGVKAEVHPDVDTGEQVAHFGGIADIHIFNGVRNLMLGKLLYSVIAMNVRTVKDGKVLPLTFRMPFYFLDEAYDVGGFGLLAAKRNR